MEKLKLKDLLVESLEKDTRDNSDLYVYTIKDKLSKNDYISLSNFLKGFKVYYSRFKSGFISKDKIDLNIVFDLKENRTTKTTSRAKRVEYSKYLKDYATKEELEDFIKNVYCKKHLNNSWYIGRTETFEKDLELFINDTISNYNRYDFNEIDLDNIRETIIHKSLGFDIDSLKMNGSKLYYELIYDKLPIIEDLKLTEEYFTATWGYDQTNVDIAQRLNKRVWGLDIFKDLTSYHGYYLVRVKDDSFSDRNKVRNYSKDLKPYETFKADASQTGQYR